MQPHQDPIHATTHIESGENDMEGHYNGQRLKVDGHDDAVIGMGNSFGRGSVLIYSVDKIIEKLVKRDGMTDEEAMEFFSFNIAGSYNGPGMPIFLFEYHDE